MVAAIQCMRDEGFEVQGPLKYPDGVLVVEPGFDPRLRLTLLAHGINSDSARWDAVNRSCKAQWSYAIEQVYLRQFSPSQTEMRAWLERAWACMEEQGIALSNPPSEQEAVDSVGHGCEPWVQNQ